MHCATKFFVACLGFIIASTANAQVLQDIWRFDSTVQPSTGGDIVFIKNSRTINFRQQYSEETGDSYDMVCRDANGNLVWSKPVTFLPNSSLSTTDNYLYVTNNSWIKAYNQDGDFLWETQPPAEGGVATYNHMRIFGNLLIVAGRAKPTGGAATDREAVIVAIDRTTGQVVYRKTFGTVANNATVTQLRSSGGNLYLHYDGGTSQLLKLDPATGNTIGFFNTGLTSFVVDSVGSVFMTSGGTFTKLNSSQPGQFSVAYQKSFTVDNSYGELLLSSGSVFMTEFGPGAHRGPTSIRKIRPSDGGSLWVVEIGGEYSPIGNLMADKYGRIFSVSSYSRGGEAWNRLYALSPNGAVLDQKQLNANGENLPLGNGRTGIAMNGFSEIAWSAMEDQSEITRLIGQKIETVADSYTAPGGTIFSSGGNSVLLNDHYANPANSTVTIVTPPSAGTLTVQANGEFTYNTNGVASGTYHFTYNVARGMDSVQGQATIIVRRGLSNLTLGRSQIAGQNATLGTVTVGEPGAATTVQVWDDSSLVATPASVNIPAGQTQASFPVQVQAVNSTINTTIFASNGGFTRSTPLTLTPLVPTALAFSPSSTVSGGTTVTCRLVINGVAGPGGRTISIYDNSAYTTVPNQVVVAPGQTEVTFTIGTLPTSTLRVSQITAAVSAGTVSAYLRVTP